MINVKAKNETSNIHRTVALSDVAEVVSGVAKGRKLVGRVEEVPYLRVANVQDGYLNLNEIKYIPAVKAEMDRYRLLSGDVLLTEGGDFDKLGRGALWTGAIENCIHQNHIFRVRLDSSKVLPDYFVLYLRSADAKNYFLRCAKKTTNLASINMGQLKALPVPVPPLQEQRKAVDILQKAISIREDRCRAVATIDNLLKSIFMKYCGDMQTNSMNWPTIFVDDVCKLVRGSSPRPKADPRYYGGTVPRLMVADLTRDGWLVTPRIDTLTEAGAKLSRPVKAGTVVVAVSGNVGLTGILAVDACIHDGFAGLTELNTSVINPYYLMICFHMLKGTHANRQAGAIFKNLTTNDLKSMEIPVPPLTVQATIENAFKMTDKLRTAATESYRRINSLLESLNQAFFEHTGG